MAVTGRDQKERAPQFLAGTELAKGLGMLEGAASEKKKIRTVLVTLIQTWDHKQTPGIV